jgi:antitoxin ParD1/3/4
MNVSLTPELEEMIRIKVESGLYMSASEVVREALRKMQDNDKLSRIRHSLAESRAQYERGEYFELTDDLWNEIEREAKEAEKRGDSINVDVKPTTR